MYDLIVIGAGPGGYKSALKAAKLGKKVLIIESNFVGGVCLNSGCIPTKSLLYSGKTYKKSCNSANIGVLSNNTTFSLKNAVSWKNSKVNELRASLEKLLESNVDLIYGKAKILDGHSITVNNNVYKSKYIIIATGSSISKPNIKGVESSIVYNSSSILNIDKIPKKLVIIGGGVIGFEFASFFKMIGSSVTIIEMASKVLRSFDDRLVKTLIKELDIEILTDTTVEEIKENSITYIKNNKLETIETDTVLIATGRISNGEQYSDIGITDCNRVVTNNYLQTKIESIYAIGDVTGKSSLAHVSEAMGNLVIDNIFTKREPKEFSNLNIPSVIYSEPEIATVGLNVKRAKERGIDVEKKTYYLQNNGRYKVENSFAKGFCIITINKLDNKIIGLEAIGTNVSEIISLGIIAITKGYTHRDFEEFIIPHPTVTETIKDGIIGF